MKAFFELSIREWHMLKKSKGLLFLLFVWPILAAILLGGIFSEKVVTAMPLAIMNEDQTSLSRTLERFTEASRSFDIVVHPQSIQEIETLLQEQKIVAALYIPKNFERNIKIGKGETITLFVNGANLVTANLSIAEMKTITATLSGGIKLKLLRKMGYSKEKSLAVISPIKMDITKQFNPGTNYLNYMPPGTWMALLHQLILLFSSLLIIREKEKKVIGHSLDMANGNINLWLTAKSFPYFLIFFLYFEIFFRLLFPLFDIEFKGNYLLMLVVSCFFIYCSLALGILISTLVSRSIDAIKGVLLIGSPAFLISGYSWPLSYMPWLTKCFSYLIPLTPFIDAYRKIYQQGGEFRHVVGDIFYLFFYGSICLCLSLFCLKKQQKSRSIYEV